MRISDWSSDVCSSDLLEKDEEVEQVARQKCAVQPQQLKLEERVEMPAAPVEPGQDCVAKHCKRQQRREQQHHRGQPVQHQYDPERSEEHTSELQSLMRISYAVFCLKKTQHIS